MGILEKIKSLKGEGEGKAELGKVEDVVLCVDASWSMEGKKIETAKDAVIAFADAKKGIDIRDHVAVVTFGSITERLVDLTNDREMIKRSVARLTVGDATPMDKALRIARDTLDKSTRKGKQPRVILLSDGCADNPQATIEEAYALKNVEVIVDTIGIGKGKEDFCEDALIEVARLTGGKYSRVEELSQLPQEYRRLAEKKPTLARR